VQNALKEYRIPFIGLKVGTHEYDFHLQAKFFEAFEFSQIEHGDIEVKLFLEKQSTMLVLRFEMKGKVGLLCDRCGDPIDQPISGKHQLIVKFGDRTGDTDDDVVVLGPAESDIDISQFLYEYAHLDLPVRHVHKSEAECNQEVLKQLKKYAIEDNADDRWIALKNMQHDDDDNDLDFLDLDEEE
jgi:uncharacterized metal-binding protein YceD (DUF177 family)